MGNPGSYRPSDIARAKRLAVGGKRKRCVKGKACSAACIAANMNCLVEMPEPVQEGLTKVKKMLQGGTTTSGAATGTPQSQSQPQPATPAASPTAGLSDYDRSQLQKAESVVNDRLKQRTPEPGDANYETERKRIEALQNLSPGEKSSLALYTAGTGYYREMNSRLRGENTTSSPMADYMTSQVNSALGKIPSERLAMARAVSGDFADSLSKLKPGEVIQDKGFGSYTYRTNRRTLSEYLGQEEDGRGALIIFRGSQFKNISALSEFQREAEHLTAPGAKMRLVKVVNSGFKDSSGNKHPIYFFEEVQ